MDPMKEVDPVQGKRPKSVGVHLGDGVQRTSIVVTVSYQ